MTFQVSDTVLNAERFAAPSYATRSNVEHRLHAHTRLGPPHRGRRIGTPTGLSAAQAGEEVDRRGQDAGSEEIGQIKRSAVGGHPE
jgi:hypothetical protein